MEDEKHFTRDMSFSVWHRTKSLRRYLSLQDSTSLSTVDLDVVVYSEFDPGTFRPIALIECALDCGQTYKCATVTTELGKLAGVAVYVVFYKLAKTPNPIAPHVADVESVRLRRTWPRPDRDWRAMSAAEFARGLLALRSWTAEKVRAAAASNDDFYETAPEQQRLFK